MEVEVRDEDMYIVYRVEYIIVLYCTVQAQSGLTSLQRERDEDNVL